jgi:hypothetical protein
MNPPPARFQRAGFAAARIPRIIFAPCSTFRVKNFEKDWIARFGPSEIYAGGDMRRFAAFRGPSQADGAGDRSMFGEQQKILARLKNLRAEVAAGSIMHSPLWNDADVWIGQHRPRQTDPYGFAPTNRWVVTEFPWELSWLFERAGDAFGPAVTLRTRYVFYGKLADAANQYLDSHPKKEQTARDLLLSVIDEALAMAEELGE